MSGRNIDPTVEEILASIKKVISEGAAVGEPTKKSDSDILELSEDFRAEESEEALVTAAKVDAMRQSLSALSAISQPGARPQIVRAGETSLEDLVTELLRPALKEWLDAHLPEIVESAVTREIARITQNR